MNKNKRLTNEELRYKNYINICFIMNLFFVIELVVQFAKEKIEIIPLMSLVLLLFIPWILVKMKKSLNKNFILLGTQIPMICAWIYMLFTSETLIGFSVLLGLLSAMVVLGTVKEIIILDAIALIVNIIRIVQFYNQGNTSATDIGVYSYIIMFTIFFGFSCSIGANTVNGMMRRNRQMVIDLEAKQEQQEEMVQNLINTSHLIYNTSEQLLTLMNSLNSMSNEMTIAVETIKEGAREGAEDTQRQLIATNKIQDMITTTSTESNLMDTNTKEMSVTVTRGMDIVDKLYSNNEISQRNTQNVYNTIIDLKDKSDNIVAIIETINIVTRQTNLLALNAAIEAARVGEAGKGFAVVADEIRKLAEQSSVSANNIGTIIKDLQEQTNKSVEAVEEMNSLTNDQNALVENTKHIFETISKDIKDNSKRIMNFVKSMNDVVLANKEIVETSNSLSAITEENYSSSESTVNLTEEYVYLAKKGNELVHELKEAAEKLGNMNTI